MSIIYFDICSIPLFLMILEQTIRMMQRIGKKVVAEGAETVEAVETLRSMDCDYIQGFYYSKPLPAPAFMEFLKARNAG